jgi:hypothetical protein
VGWKLNWSGQDIVRFQGVGSDRCINMRNGIAHPRELSGCTGDASQQWQAEQLGNGQVLLHKQSQPDLCLDIAGGPNDPDQGRLKVNSCNSANLSQQWLFTSFDPTGTPEPDHPHEDL